MDEGAQELLTDIGGGATGFPPVDGTWRKPDGSDLWEQTRINESRPTRGSHPLAGEAPHSHHTGFARKEREIYGEDLASWAVYYASSAASARLYYDIQDAAIARRGRPAWQGTNPTTLNARNTIYRPISCEKSSAVHFRFRGCRRTAQEMSRHLPERSTTDRIAFLRYTMPCLRLVVPSRT
jgi:hypothetical protein